MSASNERQRQQWYDFVRSNPIMTREQQWEDMLSQVRNFVRDHNSQLPRLVNAGSSYERELAQWLDQQITRFGYPPVITAEAREQFAEVQQTVDAMLREDVSEPYATSMDHVDA